MAAAGYSPGSPDRTDYRLELVEELEILAEISYRDDRPDAPLVGTGIGVRLRS